MGITLFEGIGGVAACFFAWYATNDLLAALCMGTLLIGWKLVSVGNRLYVLPLAFTFHWDQTSLGIFYNGLTGRALTAIDGSDYQPMVLIGLGCCLAWAIGLRLGSKLIKEPDPSENRPEFACSFRLLLIIYVVTVVLEASMTTAAADFPNFRQIIVTFDCARLGILYLVLRRLCHPEPRWLLIMGVVGWEVLLGMTGFFAGFREPMVLAAMATMEVFDKRNVRHWAAMGFVAASMAGLGLLWIGIRVEYRKDYVAVDNFQLSRSARVDRLSSLAGDWFNSDKAGLFDTADNLVDRMWAIYYPALAIKRVPSNLPHTDGAILMAALTHLVTPRIFFPDKPDLPSDSEMVRKYANINVAGRESDTSIAFGYAAEAYIDYGLPWMFVPVFFFGLVMGILFSLFRKLIWHRELFVAFATVTMWLSLYLFERSWATLLGVALAFFVYLGVPVLILDRFLLVRSQAKERQDEGVLYPQSGHSRV
jgi:hypothetical protein